MGMDRTYKTILLHLSVYKIRTVIIEMSLRKL